jgi:hypothetical protein
MLRKPKNKTKKRRKNPKKEIYKRKKERKRFRTLEFRLQYKTNLADVLLLLIPY